MEVAILSAHAADVEGEHALHRQQTLFLVVGDVHHDPLGHFEIGAGLLDGVAVHLVAEGGVVEGQPTVGDLRRLGHVFRAFGTDEDGHIGAERVGDGLQGLAEAPGSFPGVGEGVVFAVVGDGLFPSKHLLDDGDVFPGAGQGLGEGAAVPAFHHLGPRYAKAKHEAALGKVIKGERCHGHGRGRARGKLAHRRAQANLRGMGADPGQGREGVGAVGLGGPDRVVAEALGGLDRLDKVLRRVRAPVAELEPKLHAFHASSPFTMPPATKASIAEALRPSPSSTDAV